MAYVRKERNRNFNLPPHVLEALEWLAEQQARTRTEVLRRAVLHEKVLHEARNDGKRVLLVRDDVWERKWPKWLADGAVEVVIL